MNGVDARRRYAAVAAGLLIAMPWCMAHDRDGNGGLVFETVTHRGETFQVVRADLRSVDLRIYWQDEQGQNYATYKRLNEALAEKNQTLRFACNAGIFTPEFAPAGLHVENGKQLRKLNTREGAGNFHLMPNGVFYVDDSGAHVVDTETYVEREPEPRLATQSGPMLVIDGKIHPRFTEGSDNVRVRNGVGVSGKHTVVFALSDGLVNFYDFASLYRDVLECDNALFLDGDLASFYALELGKPEDAGICAGILAVVGELTETKDKDE